ncbi:hypothetical protein OESDEN_10879 [Oesophagostomum dentatum]|uniref:Major facilitator superfamily (MFS) profile domain-containing protein n=1 Tax=Oesophagostomum dentatum TaxID=61180 RepID=A0A0B1T1L2_OESDE|nr:hypothetical protein OESDEN_10879 [Oesophagostomum dentatum]
MTAGQKRDSTESGSLPKKDVLEKPSTPWKSVYIATVCSFIQEAQFSILLSSMWPYLRKLNPNAEEVQFGYVVAMYSLGQCISAPSLGYWSNRIKQVRLPLLTGFSFMMAGSSIYLLLSFFSPSCVAMAMMAARFVHGCGSGMLVQIKTSRPVNLPSVSKNKQGCSKDFKRYQRPTNLSLSGFTIPPNYSILFVPGP